MENIPWTPVLRRVADSLFLLQGLSEEERRTLWAGAPLPVRFEKGESIYSCHAFRRALGVMLQGEAQVWRAGEDGRRVVMNRLPAGSVFGAAALFGECEAYVTEISALRRCAVLFVSQQQASDWMRGHYAIAENYIRFLSGRIRFLNQKIAEFTDGQTEDRLVRYFLDHPERRWPGYSAGQPDRAGADPQHWALEPLPFPGRADRVGSRPPGRAADFCGRSRPAADGKSRRVRHCYTCAGFGAEKKEGDTS